MIDISMLATNLQTTLNNAIEEQVSEGNTLLDNDMVKYDFLVHIDGGEYRDFDYLYPNGMASANERTNKIVRYINCEFDTTGSQSDGVLNVEMTLNARLEILIPLINAGKKKDRLELVNTIRQIIDNTFRLNSTGQIEDDGTVYNYGVVYQLADTGERDKRAEIGDSILLNVYLSYYIVEMGINSDEFELYIDGVRVPITRIGFNRSSQNENNVPSDATNISGKNYATSTVFGLNFDMPLRRGTAGNQLMAYLFESENLARFVEIKYPFGDTTKTTGYLMVFNDTSINGEKTKFASVSCVMVEADLDVNELSPYAEQNWSGTNG
jgi:hypothetical protein